MNYLKKYYGVLLIVGLLALPFVMQSYYVTRLFTTMGIYLIIAMGLNMLLGYTGLVSIGQAGIFGLTAYVAGILMRDFGLSFWLAVIAACLTGALLGLFIGAITLKLKAAYLAITTLGLSLIIIKTVATNWRSVTNGAEGFLKIPKPKLFGYTIKESDLVLLVVLVFTIAVFLILRNITKSKLGRNMRAVRDDEIAASMMGINVVHTKLFAFTCACTLAGLSGCLYGGLYGALFPDYFSMDLSVLFLCMVVLGGSGTLLGPIIGAFLVTFGQDALAFLGEGQMLGYGILVVLICVLKPGGIIEIFYEIKNRVTSKRMKKGVAENG